MSAAFDDQKLSTRSPIDGAVVASREYPASLALLDAAVDTAHGAHRAWRAESLEHRVALVRKGVDHLAGRAPDLAPELTLQMGRPARYAAAEFATFKDRAAWLLDHAQTALADESVDEGRPAGLKRVIRRAPLGVCLLVGAWNVSRTVSFSLALPVSALRPLKVLLHAHLLVLPFQFCSSRVRSDSPPGASVQGDLPRADGGGKFRAQT